MKQKATIRWFNKLSGEGVVRLLSTKESVPFYLCNFEGADSMWPHLVSNIKLKNLDLIEGEIDLDSPSLGFINMRKVDQYE